MKNDLVIALMLSGCVHVPSISKFTHAECVVTGQDALRERVAFEFGCKPAELKVTPVGGDPWQYGSTAGVDGCGWKAIYKYLGYNTGWVEDVAKSK